MEAKFEIGDRVKNPSQRRGFEFEVVDIREKQSFGGHETQFVVREVHTKTGNLVGSEDAIPERDHDNWERVE